MRTETSAVVVAPGRIELREFPLPPIGSAELLLRIELVSICGSDPHHFLGGATVCSPRFSGTSWSGCGGDRRKRRGRVWGRCGDRIVVEPYIRAGDAGTVRRGTTSFVQPPHLWREHPLRQAASSLGGYGHTSTSRRDRESTESRRSIGASRDAIVRDRNGVRWVATKGALRTGDAGRDRRTWRP